jgi:hypothetical protein
MQKFLLAPHVYPCVTDDHVVLLDLARDKYIGVGREQMGALAEHVEGWPRIGGSPAVPGPDARSPNTRADAVVNKMLAAGMLTRDPAVGKEAQPLRMPPANAALVEPDLDWRPAVAFSDVVRFLMASLITAVAMRLLPIRSVVMGTARRKAAAASSAKPFDVDVARRATEVFLYLRPLLFSAQDACLFDSLALTRFLSYYRQFPSCVIGVQTGPFGAHCWVQEGDVVFNDAPEYVRRFTPILAV